MTDDKDTILAQAERNTQDTINTIKQLASQHNVAIAGSFLARTASQLYNRAFFIEPNSDETFYDKRHIFGIGGEDVYNAGKTEAPMLRYRGWNIKVIVCYDLRFPAWCRNNYRNNSPYDLMLVISSWPKARVHPWKTLLAARAIENISYVCGANRSGITPGGIDFASGLSALYDSKGGLCEPQTTPLASGNIYSYTLDKAALEHFRQKFPAWQDADTFILQM